MFDGSSEQFHQFIASSSTTSLPFPLHVTPSSFDPYAPPLHHHPPPPPPPPSKTTESSFSDNPWSNDELLSLLKLRSSMEIWFPDFTWEHVSRKLGEVGFKRSAEQCKEKFEEESRNFNNNKSYRMMSELDELCHGEDRERGMEEAEEDPKEAEEEGEQVGKDKESKKRKRRDKLERFKGFCEAAVKKMMAKQDQLHDQLIQDILRRDEERIAREEAWKNRELERFRTQIETRSKDQKSAAERQTAIVEILTHFTSRIDNQQQQQQQQREQERDEEPEQEQEEELINKSNSNSSSSIPQSQNNNNNNHEKVRPSSPSSTPAASFSDVGKRWPRDEVVALINLRSRMSGEQETSKEKGPLWERISQGMMEMGHKRSAKRCKEKWENINKYFRKTKDSSKKRSLNSRTCPYFHHLSSLYGDGTVVAPTASEPENASAAVVELGGERAADVDGVF